MTKSVAIVVLLVGALVHGEGLAAGDVLFDLDLRRDSRDAPIPSRVCRADIAIECATEHYKSADEQLNIVYGLVRKRLQEVGPSGAEENLIRAQRAWIEFRDSHCRWAGEYMQRDTGLHSFYAIACMEVETVRRTYYLQRYSR